MPGKIRKENRKRLYVSLPIKTFERMELLRNSFGMTRVDFTRTAIELYLKEHHERVEKLIEADRLKKFKLRGNS